MLQSLILTSNPQFCELDTMVLKHYHGEVSEKYSFDTCLAAVRGHTVESLQHAVAENDKSILIFSGRVTNLATLRYALLGVDSNFATCTVAKILLDLYTKMGINAFSLLEGEFSVIIKTGNSIKAYTDSFGMLPLYYVVDKTGFFWFTNEVKSILEVDAIDFSIKVRSDLYPNVDNPGSFSYFKTIKKIPPGCQFEINTSRCANDQFSCVPYHSNHYATNDYLNKALTIEILDKLLQKSIEENLNHDVAGLSLSGGLDSSLISAIANKYAKKVHTFSLGTDTNNEFAPAKLVSEFLGTTHHEMIFTQKDLITSLLHTIFYNEVLDSVCVEVHMPFWILLSRISEYTPCVFTGFGADMLFSGHASPDADLSLVHQKIKTNIARVQWRGEYTPFVAQKLGVDVHHPFCGSKLIAIATSLDPKLKIFDGQVKYVLRELASQKRYLPDEICRRKKIALEEASSINKLFSDYLGLSSPFAYEQKDNYTYLIFKELFEGKKLLQNMDVNQYVEMIETESFA